MSLATGSQTTPSFSSPTHLQPLFPVTTGTPPSLANPLPSSHSTVPSPHAGMVLSPAAEPYSRKLVEKVRSGQFIEMRELLADNIALIHQLESIQGCTPLHTLGPTRPRLREVSSLPTWCYCFLGYMAILTSDPSTRDQLAYARLVIKEALRHGGQGWLDYDRAFRQQAAAEPSLRWNTLLPGLLASTILGQRNRQEAAFCTLCLRGTTHGPSVLWFTCSHQLHVTPQPLILLPAGVDRIIFARPGTGGPAYSQATVLTDTFVPHATSLIRRRIVQEPQTPPTLNNSEARPSNSKLYPALAHNLR